jgi:putative tryptophan/tyrosine transport system substrate-binding protein
MLAALRFAILGLLGAATLAARPAGAADAVLLLLSERGGVYAEAAEAMGRELIAVADVSQRIAGEAGAPQQPAPRAAVAIGAEACRRLVENGLTAPHRLCVLLPKAAFDRIAGSARARGRLPSAVLLDQPASRQMALIRLALPERRGIAILHGPETAALGTVLAASAGAQGLRAVTERIERVEELPAALQRVLAGQDLLLAVPDGMVYNSHTIQNILRASFARYVPLMGFSPAYVRAGALLALYSTPAQVGAQAGRALRAALAGSPLPPQQHPQAFEVEVNPHVARSMGIELEDGALLTERLRRLESAR